MVTVSRDHSRDISDAYIRALTELMKLFKQVRLHQIATESGCNHRIWWDIVTPSTLWPQQVYLDFKLFGALKNTVWYKV
jgi:hypothetical protein